MLDFVVLVKTICNKDTINGKKLVNLISVLPQEHMLFYNLMKKYI